MNLTQSTFLIVYLLRTLATKKGSQLAPFFSVNRLFQKDCKLKKGSQMAPLFLVWW